MTYLFMFVSFFVGLFVGKRFLLSGVELKEIKEAEAELDTKLAKFNALDKELKLREDAILKMEKKGSAKQSKKQN